MNRLDWIKDLVRAEQQMEDSGIVDIAAGFDADKTLVEQSVEYLETLKDQFIQSASAFNQLRGLTVGGVKIYGISNSQSDFMLFRNGYKLIFSVKKPGQISIRFTFQGAGMLPGTAAADQSLNNATNEDLIEARWGAFGELAWFYRDKPVNAEYLVRYYTSRFIKESAK
jgi:hypothetical protein